MLTTILLLLLQSVRVGAQPPPGPESLWETTILGERPATHTGCAPAAFPTDESYGRAVDEMDPAGARCSAPKITRTADSWIREKTCRDGDMTVTIRAIRRGDIAKDATFTTEILPAGAKTPSWSISTRLRRLGPCPKEAR